MLFAHVANVNVDGSNPFTRFDTGSFRVTYLGDGRYRVRSWVDSQNAFGVLIRMNYTAIVVDRGNEGWAVESMESY